MVNSHVIFSGGEWGEEYEALRTPGNKLNLLRIAYHLLQEDMVGTPDGFHSIYKPIIDCLSPLLANGFCTSL